jgi:SAM-dependent methyltransferase
MARVDIEAVNWADWAERWEAQQQLHIPRREQRFQVMVELVAEIVGPEPGTVLDLACGPGSISRRLLARFPSAQVVALDADPVLLEIGRRTLGDANGRLRWVQADLRTEQWDEQLRAMAPFDAVLTSTALHWLSAGELVRVYRALGELVRPGGVVFNAEHLPLGAPAGRLAERTQALRQRLGKEERRNGESFNDWWMAAQEEPGFAAKLEERRRIFGEIHPHHESVTARFHEEALQMAGFAESAVVWRYLDDTIVGAIR